MKENNAEKDWLEPDNLLDLKLSFSRVSDYDQNGPKTLVNRSKVEGQGVDMGGLIDAILFDHASVARKYYMFDGDKPTATLGTLCDYILENSRKIPSTKEVLDIIEAKGFWSGTKDPDKMLAKFDHDDFWGYLKAQFESTNKTLITTKDYEFCLETVNVLRTHPHSREMVAYPKQDESKYVQFEVEYRYKDVMFRGILDMLTVNHTNKTVEMIDLKTGANPADQFMKSFMKYRYYLQAKIYLMAFVSICKQLNLQGYTLLPFKFLYISRYENIPMVYTVTDKWEKAAIDGFTTASGYKYKGLNELLDEIHWHWTNKKFDMSMEMYKSEGSLTLKDDFIEVNE